MAIHSELPSSLVKAWRLRKSLKSHKDPGPDRLPTFSGGKWSLPRQPGLELDFNSNWHGDATLDSLETLITHPEFSGIPLVTLRLSINPRCRDESMETLGGSPQLTAIRDFESNPGSNRDHDAHVGALLATPAMAELDSVWLHAGVAADGTPFVRRPPNLKALMSVPRPGLRHLHVGGPELSRRGLREFGRHNWFPTLRSIGIPGAQADDWAAVGKLVANSPDLQMVDLSGSNIGTEGLPLFLGAAKLPKLGALDLRSTGLTDAALPHLLALAERGVDLRLNRNALTKPVLQELRAAAKASGASLSA